MHETLFFICGGILAASAIVVSLFGLKNDNFPGKWMPLIIVWFAVFAIGAGTFAVLHGKDESKDHSKEYAKASEEIQKRETTGPFEEAELEAAEAEEAEEPEAEEESEEGSEAAEEAEEGPEGGAEQEGAAGEEAEGEAGASAPGGDPEAGAVVFSENCSTCHGATGHGGNGGPDLRTMPLAQSEEGAIQQVTNGGGGMPAFGGTLSEEEIENVAAYVAQDITEGE
jgi:mono/diheme cytochrome c family protein